MADTTMGMEGTHNHLGIQGMGHPMALVRQGRQLLLQEGQ